MQLAESVAQFLAALLTFDRLQPATIRTYRSGLAGLVARHGELDVALLEKALVTTWLLEVNQGKAPDTVRLTLVAWERWQAWAVAAGHIEAPLLARQRKPSGRQRTALPSKEQIRTLVAHAPADWLLLFRALRLTGARPGELCRATIADLTRDRGSIVLQQHKTARKTGQAREIALGHAALPDRRTDSRTASCGSAPDVPSCCRTAGTSPNTGWRNRWRLSGPRWSSRRTIPDRSNGAKRRRDCGSRSIPSWRRIVRGCWGA